jgi:hypothetical protein
VVIPDTLDCAQAAKSRAVLLAARADFPEAAMLSIPGEASDGRQARYLAG